MQIRTTMVALLVTAGLGLAGCSESSNEGDNPFEGFFGSTLEGFVFTQCRRLPENETAVDIDSVRFSASAFAENSRAVTSQFTGNCVLTGN